MKSKKEFLEQISDKQKSYDFSLIPNEFLYKDKINVICHEKDSLGMEHGVFTTDYSHFVTRGDCCPKCNGKFMDKELFVHEATRIHGDKYDYSKFEFVNKNTKSIIICKNHGVEFEQMAKKHLDGHGCPICRYENTSKNEMMTQEEFISRANIAHGGKYDYSKTKYEGLSKKVCITCKEHGDFYMLGGNHINKDKPQGCPICGREKHRKSRIRTADMFERLATERHDGKYKYFGDYVESNKKVNIECPKHGVFEMTPSNHLYGQGCPTCGMVYTVPEKTIVSFIKEIFGEDEEIIIHSRKIIEPYELDIFIPRINLAFEYNGLVWHSEKFSDEYKTRHLKKLNACNEKGIRLIQIFEDEWLEKKDIVLSRIKSILGVYDNVIFARKCVLKDVDYSVATDFLNNNHLQGFCPSQIQSGLYYNNELVALMTFGHTRQMKKYNENYETTWELLRFATKRNTKVVGGASRLLKDFMNNDNVTKIVSYADKRWSDGNLYFRLGFTKTHDSNPNYFYVFGKARKNRFNFRKSILVKKGFDKNKSEHEIMKEQGIYRIYDCGTMVFTLEK